jgi:hypothetical protein
VSLVDPVKVQLAVIWTYNFGPEEVRGARTEHLGHHGQLP